MDKKENERMEKEITEQRLREREDNEGVGETKGEGDEGGEREV